MIMEDMIRKKIYLICKTLCLGFIVFCLSACQSIPIFNPDLERDVQQEIESSELQNRTIAEQGENEQPGDADQAPETTLQEQPGPFVAPEHRFNISASSLPAKQFFMALVSEADVNIVIHPDVSGEISIDLKQVTIEEALMAVRDVYGYHFEKTSYGYQILPLTLQTRIFHLNYLNVKRRGHSSTSVSSGEITKGGSSASGGAESTSTESGGGSSINTAKSSSIDTESEADFWSDLKQILQMIVGNGDSREVVVNPQSGIVVIRAFPEELNSVERFIRAAEKSLQRQVVIEAKVMEVSLDSGFESGINWSAIGRYGDGKTSSTQFSGNELSNVSPGGVFSVLLNLNDFQGVIDLLERQGSVQVLSSPRISTVNNQKAVIKVGTDEFYVTELSSNSAGTGDNEQLVPEVTLTPFFSGIALDVTPQIGEKNDVILHIHPTVSEVVDQTKEIIVGSDKFSLPLAQSSIRESDSIVRAQSQQIIVIGGLLRSESGDLEATVPWLSRIPGAGALFAQKRKSTKKSELVILLKPMIVGSDSWSDLVRDHGEHFQDLYKQKSKTVY